MKGQVKGVRNPGLRRGTWRRANEMLTGGVADSGPAGGGRDAGRAAPHGAFAPRETYSLPTGMLNEWQNANATQPPSSAITSTPSR
jgi:hypothetical protein